MIHRVLLLGLLLLVVVGCEKQPTVEDAFKEASEEEKWYYIHVPGMICRDNSNTGIGVRLKNGSKKLIVYLDGSFGNLI